ncbi:MAG TPA: hypothetical protein PKJ08_06890 [Candidatus Cloacimonadota bacterium]|nr:hypothetical protein [Candidatus Cloacimonadota bacterium]
MDNLKILIDEYLEQHNPLEKDNILNQLILYCFKKYSNQTASDNGQMNSVLNQLSSMLNFFMLRQSTGIQDNIQTQLSEMNGLIQKKEMLLKQLELKQKDINTISDDIIKMEEFLKILNTLDKLIKESPDLKIVSDNYQNDFQYLKYLADSYHELKKEMSDCGHILDIITKKTDEIIKQKKDFEDYLRSKTNEV